MKLPFTCLLLVAVTIDAVPLEGSSSGDVKTKEPPTTSTHPRTFGQWHRSHGIRAEAFVNQGRNKRPIEELNPNREANPYENDIDHHVVEAVVPEVQQSNIVASAGYSGDSQQIAPQLCYNATISSTSGQQGYIQLDTAISFSDLESKLGISAGVNGKFGMFSADAEASYVRSLQDKDYSLSLNYYEYVNNKVAIQLADYGKEALTENGKKFYNDGKNPYFGLVCGDNYITSYDQGALLAMALNIKFSSSSAKTTFEEKAGATFGSIFSASESVKSVVSKYNIHGSVIIQAFQIGGDPSQLSKVLNKDQSGNYYALTCSLTSMDNCVKAASGLLDYAKNDFSTQFSFQNNTGLTPLGISFSQYIPIRYIGLIPPPSLVTQEVAQYRDELSNILKENEYYKQKLYPFFNQGYPVELDPAFINKLHIILSKADSNVRLLMQPHKGAADCFNVPDECKNIKSSIESQLQNITIDDLKIFEDLKYSADTGRGCQFWNTGGGSETSWAGISFPGPPPGYQLRGVNSVSMTDTQYHFSIVSDVYGQGLVHYYYSGTSGDGGLTYGGTMCYNDAQHCWPEIKSKQKSPFFFEAYNITELSD